MSIAVNGQVGPQTLQDGATQTLRLGKLAELVVTELHGRFYEQTYRGNVYGNGPLTLTALSANTITLTNTTTPILGVWNPLSSLVNLVILQATLAAGINNAATTGCGAFVWASSVGNAAITTGTVPFNHKTLQAAGSYAKGMAFTALTGLTNNLVVFEGADFPTPTIITTAAVSTAIQTPTVAYTQNIDGAFIVPPGAVLALLNVTSSTTVSVTGRLMWEEVPV
jgi:hypothetical protein